MTILDSTTGTETRIGVYPRRSDYWLKHELDRQFTRQDVVIAQGTGEVDTGAILGRITDTGEWTICKADAADGSQIPAGLNIYYQNATAEASNAPIIVRDAVVLMAELAWDPSFDTLEAKRAVMAQLADKGIVNRAVA